MKQMLQKSVWRLRDVRILLPARMISTAGTGLTTSATLLLIHDRGLGPYGVAGLLGCFSLPVILTMGVAGWIADRVDSRTVLMVAATAQALACALLGALPVTITIYVAAVIIALAQAIAQPTWSALLARVVGDDSIGPALAWQRGLNAVANPLGYAIGGLLVGVGHVRWGFWADGITYVVLAMAAGAVQTRRRPGPAVPTARTPRLEGIRITARDPLVWPLFIAILAFVVLIEGVNPLEVFLVRDVLQATPSQYGLSEIFSGAGVVLGATLAGRVAGDRRRAVATAAGFGAAAASLIAAGLAPNFWSYGALLVLLSAGFGLGNSTFGALLITRTAEQDRGKVYAALGGLSQSASMIALALGSTVGTLTTPRVAFVAAGAAGAAVMIISVVRVRRALSAE